MYMFGGVFRSGSTSFRYDLGKILSTASNRDTLPEYCKRLSNSWMALAGLIDRYPIVAPLRPQNVQCALSPHQHPRDVSNGNIGLTSPPGKFSATLCKNGR